MDIPSHSPVNGQSLEEVNKEDVVMGAATDPQADERKRRYEEQVRQVRIIFPFGIAFSM